MDFFEHQDKARRHTKLLVFYFVSAVVAIIVCVYLLVVVGFAVEGSGGGALNPELFLGVATGVIAIVCFGSLYKISELRSGGGAVARMLGGRLVSPVTMDPDERKLRNVVEEMSLASGVPVPEIYVMDEEEGINAFAAGHATSDAAVAVTRGCMRLLNRDELQGVIAHEFSHILNGDMRLNLRLMGFIHGILCLAIIGRVLLNTGSSRRSSSDSRGKNPLPFIGIGLLIIGSIGVFFGKLIKSAVSRQREFLADASAVQFTRNPLGLANALKKIGGLSSGSKIENPQAEAASHLFFANGLTESWASLFATHPTLEQRIKLLDPSFDGQFARVEAPQLAEESADELVESMASRMSPPPVPRGAAPPPQKARPAPPGTLVRRAGQFTPKHLAYASEVRRALPEPVAAAARSELGAVALVYSLIFSADWATRVAQIEQLKASCEPGVLAEVEQLSQVVAALPAEARLPLLQLSLPTLRMLSAGQYENFKANIEKIINTDGVIDLTEFAWQKMLLKNLEPQFTKQGSKTIQYYGWQPLLNDAAILLSSLAFEGHETMEDARKAFEIGWAELRSSQAGALVEHVEVADVDAALNRLAVASPFIKKSMLNACAFTVAADERICPREAELLRAIADVLDCPIAPFVEGI
jgi:Zn-dependent protease with chaperone function